MDSRFRGNDGLKSTIHLSLVRNQVREFLDPPVVEIVRNDEEAVRIYGETAADLRGNWTPLPTGEIRIAAAVPSFDAHFRETARVAVLMLRPGTAKRRGTQGQAWFRARNEPRALFASC